MKYKNALIKLTTAALPATPPSTTHEWGSRTLLNSLGSPERDTSDPLHAQEERLLLFITVCGPDSVLPDVLAMHSFWPQVSRDGYPQNR